MGNARGILRHRFEEDAEGVFAVWPVNVKVPGSRGRVNQFIKKGMDLRQRFHPLNVMAVNHVTGIQARMANQ
jgi:hypothetical protein